MNFSNKAKESNQRKNLYILTKSRKKIIVQTIKAGNLREKVKFINFEGKKLKEIFYSNER